MYSKITGQMINEKDFSCFNDIEAINDARVAGYFIITDEQKVKFLKHHIDMLC